MSIVNELYKKPKRDKDENAPHFFRGPPNKEQQADLLFLPNDKGNKYCLVVADVGSRLTDAQPIKDKTSETVLKAFQVIYKRNILKIPERIDFDDGSEFKGSVAKWFKSKGVKVHVAPPYRHRKQAIVERKNQIIGKTLFKRMTEEELLTGKKSTQWIDDLPDVIKSMNVVEKKRKPKKYNDTYQCSGDSCVLLPEGTRVRVALDAPIDVASGKRLSGRFRDTDIRWKIKCNTVKQVIIQPNQPPLYLVDDAHGNTDHNQAYTRNQLLPVKANEKAARESAIRPIAKKKGQQVYHVEKLVAKKKEKNKIYLKVRWRGFTSKDDTWELRARLMEDVPELVREYEKHNK
jgi:hypothetical protein